MMHGEPNILWRGKTQRFAKSSGTTSDKSKFIPVTQENLQDCHLKGPKTTLAFWYRDHPRSRFFQGKGLILGGSVSAFPAYPQTWMEYEVEDQGTGDQGKRIRFTYYCAGVDIAG